MDRQPETTTMRAADRDAELRALLAACAEADGVEPFNEAAMLELAEREALVLGNPGEEAIAGAAILEELPADGDGPAPLGAELAVAPDARGRGLGARLAAALRERAAERPLLVWSHGDLPAARALAERLGAERVRVLLRLGLRLDEARRAAIAAEAELPAPEGVEIGAFRPGRDEEELLAVNAEAFRSHPEQGRLDLEGLRARMAEPWFSPDRLLLARDAACGALLGFHWLKLDGEEAEVYVLGVADAAAGRGIGRALMRRGLAILADSGRPEASLYVEGDNEPALALYRSLGFERRSIDVRYRLEPHLEPSPAAR